MNRMARWDRETAGRPNRYVAISHYVAGRIRRYYNREATVVYPPVDTDFFHPDSAVGHPVSGRYALVVSALVPYKRVDLAIDACRLAGVPLKIVGGGPDRATLERYAAAGLRAAGDNPSVHEVKFLGPLTDEGVRQLYRHAAVVILPGEEDFGIVPLEAQACGRPVVAYARGGALETVIPDETGLLVDDASPAAFADAIRRVVDRPFDGRAIRRHAERFGRTRFGNEITAIVGDTLAALGAPQRKTAEAVRW
jgi:glycosyltransferase involved in cell wall biosynthesis